MENSEFSRNLIEQLPHRILLPNTEDAPGNFYSHDIYRQHVCISNELFLWLEENAGFGSESYPLPVNLIKSLQWHGRLIRDIGRLDKHIELRFRNSEDAVYFRMTWL